jgi:hypothetical protein
MDSVTSSHTSDAGVITIFQREDGLGFLKPTVHILDEVHVRHSWWPFDKFSIALQQYPLNLSRIVNRGVVLLELDYSIKLRWSYRGH